MSAVLEYTVTEKHAGKSVEQVLKKKFNVSSSLITYLKLNARLFINGKVCRSVDVVSRGDILTADVSENNNGFGNILPWEKEIDVIFEDDYLLIVNKPGNMASHPCLGNYDQTLANAVMYYWHTNGEYHNYHIVNRLDKDTSGICVIAKNRFAHGVISQQMREGCVEKGYMAIVHGTPEPENGYIESPIKRADASVIKRIVTPDGKYAKTIYETVNTVNNFSLQEIRLETGRTHQIRVHFSYIGHPLVGDWLYGNGDEEKELIARQALHAGYIKFIHPADKSEMSIKCDLPQDMINLLNRCEKEMENNINVTKNSKKINKSEKKC